jgi:hypothetical protein
MPDAAAACAELTSRGVRFLSEPVDARSSVHVHFLDLYGNSFVLVELRSV